MAEDFTKYTLLDSGNDCITVNSATSLSIAGTTDDLYSLHSDKGAAHFSGDFEHIVETSGSGTGICAFWGLSNVVDAVNPHDTKQLDTANKTFLYATWAYYTTLRLYIRECQSGSLATDICLSGAGTFYCEIERDEDTGTYGTLLCRIYSDSARTTLVDTLSLTLRAKDDFRTVYGAWSQYTSPGSFSVTVANLDLQEAGTTHTVTGAITLPAVEVSGTVDVNCHYVTGAIEIPAVEVSATASRVHKWDVTGSITIPAVEVSGTADRIHKWDVTGAIEIPSVSVEGTAARIHKWDVTGAVEIPGIAVEGTASRIHKWDATGAIEIPGVTVEGTAARWHAWTVSADIGIPSVEVEGTAARKHFWTVSGDVEIPPVEVSGEARGVHSWTVTGAIVVPSVTVDGTANLQWDVTADIEIPAVVVYGLILGAAVPSYLEERWYLQQNWHATQDPVRDLREWDRLQAIYVELADTGAANTLNTVRHGLGRIPRGVRIVNAIVPLSGDVTWHRLNTDSEWTDQLLTLRFNADNARVLLEVF